MTRRRPGYRTAGRCRRPAGRLAAWALVVGLLPVLAPAIAEPAQAVEGVCFLAADGTLDCPDPTSQAAEPPTLVSAEAYEAMTAAQRDAMRRFEDRAVEGVLIAHGLPAQDADDVLLWSPEEAGGLLQMLVMEAVMTPSGDRTADQHEVATWLGALVAERNGRVSRQTGAEYAAWAGLNVDRYWELVHSGASKAELTDYLSRLPQPYSGSSPSTSTGGFCKYRPPAPFTDQYVGYTSQSCYAPCTNYYLGGCIPAVELGDLRRWAGARLVAGQAGPSDEEVNLTSLTITAGASLAGWAGAQVGLQLEKLPLLIAMTEQWFPLMTRWPSWDYLVASNAEKLNALEEGWKLVWMKTRTTEYQRSLKQQALDLLLRPARLKRTLQAQIAWLQSTKALSALRGARWTTVNTTWEMRLSSADEILRQVNRLDFIQELAKFSSGWLELVQFALEAGIDTAFKVAESEALPGRIASAVVAARSFTGDPGQLLTALDALSFTGTTPGTALFRHEFARALRRPADCSVTTCAPTPVKPRSSTDPRILVRDVEAGVATQVSQIAIGKVVDDSWTPSSVRVSGGWFVELLYDPEAGLELQSTALHYLDHDLKSRTAWLIRHDDGSYQFLVAKIDSPDFDLGGCMKALTCEITSQLEYLDAAGSPMVALVEPDLPPVGAPTVTPWTPAVGQLVALSGTGFLPGGTTGSRVYQWRFQRDDCGGPCVVYVDGQPAPAYSARTYGGTVQRSWRAPGTFAVELTVTDSAGRKAVAKLEVRVG